MGRNYNKKYDKLYNEKKSSKKRRKWWIIPIVVVLIVVVVLVVNNVKRNSYGDQISSVAISSLPNKVEYYVGEEPNYEGFTVSTTYNNGTTFTEGPEACTFSGFNSEFAVEKQTITVVYGEHTFAFDITIKEPIRPFSPLVKISFDTLPKTEYKVGDWLDVSEGVLILEYEDGYTRKIRLEYNHIYDFSTENPGKFTITVKLREDGYLATCTYEINVKR